MTLQDENEDHVYDYEPKDASIDSEDKPNEVQSSKGMKMAKDKEIGLPLTPTKLMNQTHSPSILSPVDSPKTSSSRNSSPNKPDVNSKKEAKSILRLLSCRITDSSDAASLPVSPCKSNDHSISPVDSDVEVVVVCLKS